MMKQIVPLLGLVCLAASHNYAPYSLQSAAPINKAVWVRYSFVLKRGISLLSLLFSVVSPLGGSRGEHPSVGNLQAHTCGTS